MSTGAALQTAALISATNQGYNNLRSSLGGEEGQPLRDLNHDQV